MNNEQFRRLIFDNPSPSTAVASPLRQGNGDSKAGKVTALGSRTRPSAPMTPRSVKGVDFARQLAEHRRESQQPPVKKFKAPYVHKATKLSTGCRSQAFLRQPNEGGGDNSEPRDIEKRIKALEEMVKLNQIDQATFEKLRKEIGVGGNISGTHLIKGLDWELLRRVKAGEDVTRLPEKKQVMDDRNVVMTENVDEEFDRVLEKKEKEVIPTTRKDKRVEKDDVAALLLPSGSEKRVSRDEILRQLKASRAAAASTEQVPEQAEASLGSKFKKIGDGKDEKKRWIEEDEQGRRKEVLLVTDADGTIKRKVRWLDKSGSRVTGGGLLMPDKKSKPLGMDVPIGTASKVVAIEKSKDDDIFEGVGADYNPLGDIGDDSTSSESEREPKSIGTSGDAPQVTPTTSECRNTTSPQPPKTRNYFSTAPSTLEPTESLDRWGQFSNDPAILATLKRAAALRQASPSAEAEANEEEGDSETLFRRKRFLEEARRQEAQDILDIDYGFGSSRIEDEEDEEGIWEGPSGNKRKRGPKKRKGDKDNAVDVLRVLDGRRKEKS